MIKFKANFMHELFKVKVHNSMYTKCKNDKKNDRSNSQNIKINQIFLK